ncbi:MAG: response regulator [Rhizomicrobium sp.]
MVVDDNQHMRKLVVTILQAFGVVQIFEAADGNRAWAMMRETNPDVVLLDWMMEGMNGLDVVKLVRTSPQTPNPFVPIIMLTGYTQAERVRQARDAGANEFLAKPVSVEGGDVAAGLGDRAPAPLCAHQGLFRSLPAAPRQGRISRTRAALDGVRHSEHGGGRELAAGESWQSSFPSRSSCRRTS